MAGEVLAGPERRRRWSDEERAEVISEMARPGVKISDIARQRGISRSLLYTWRRAAAAATSSVSAVPDLVPVMIAGTDTGSKKAPAGATGLGSAKSGGSIEVALPCGARVTVRGKLDERALRVILGMLRPA